MLNQTDFRLLQLLARVQTKKAPVTVERLAQHFGTTAAFVSQRLRRLEKEGCVERQPSVAGGARVVYYFPRPLSSIQWVSASEDIALTWQAVGEVDWSFPLIGQIADLPARLTVLRLLERLRGADLLDSWTRKTWIKNVSRQFNGLTIILYGSTARGEARQGADVDLLLVHGDATPGYARQAVELAEEVNLGTPRPIQAKDLNVQQFLSAPTRIQEAIRREGVIVYDGLRTKPGGETLNLWNYVYGERPDERG